MAQNKGLHGKDNGRVVTILVGHLEWTQTVENWLLDLEQRPLF